MHNPVRTAIILAGGEGLRLRPLTNDNPKAMIMVAGKPLLQWIIERLKHDQIFKIVIGVAYKKEKIMDYFKDGKQFGVTIQYSNHTVEGGTGEGFRLAIRRFVDDEMFLGMNGDELVDIRIPKFVNFHRSAGGIATIAVAPLRSPYGVVDIQGNDVIGFKEKPTLFSHYVSVGNYVLSREIIPYLPDKGDIERTCFPELAAAGKLKAYVHKGFWTTINTIKDLKNAEELLSGRI